MLTLRHALLALFIPIGIGCKGADCDKTTECNTDGGESCLFPAGGGCSAQGHCEKQDTCKVGAGAPSLLCTCGNVGLALQCIPSNGITDRTTNGACQSVADAGADGGSDE